MSMVNYERDSYKCMPLNTGLLDLTDVVDTIQQV